MRITELILLASLVAVGTVGFLDQHAMSRARLERIIGRERRLKAEIRRLRQRQNRLQSEADALRRDPYYIERMAREQLAWLPVYSPAPPPSAPPGSAEAEQALVDASGALQHAERPGSSDRRRAAEGRALLTALGYDTAKHFQNKMMGGDPTDEIDGRTVARARGLLALLRQCGYSSVQRFQARHGLTADGILGQRTEKRLRQVLSDRRGRRSRPRRNGMVAHGAEDEQPPPGG